MFVDKIKSFLNRNVEAVLIIVVILGGVGISGFGLYGLRQSIVSPFSIEAPSQDLNIALVPQLDTDRDGLLDIDEVNTYSTSPYLADSDSDGASDSDEIANGANPNCPEGKDCVLVSAPGSGGDNTSGQTSPAVNLPTGSISAAELRQQLIASGVPADGLNSLTDEELLAAYSAALQDVSNTANQQPGTTTGSNSNSLPQTLSASEIRRLLKEGGMTDDQLSKLTDQELIQAYTKTQQQVAAGQNN